MAKVYHQSSIFPLVILIIFIVVKAFKKACESCIFIKSFFDALETDIVDGQILKNKKFF